MVQDDHSRRISNGVLGVSAYVRAQSMTRSLARGGGTHRSTHERERHRPTQMSPGAWIAVAACVALALWVHRRSLGAFFSTDDLIALERARDLVPPQPIAWWRWLSGPGYFESAVWAFGVRPAPYHVVCWLLHGINVAALFALVRRWRGSVVSATVAAAWFGSSQLSGTVLDQAVGVEVLLALAFTLAAFLVVDPTRPRRIALAAALFAVALFSKESVLLVPLVLLIPLADGGAWWGRMRVAVVLLAEGVAMTAGLFLARAHVGTFGGQAYAVGWGANLWHNLMTYLSWAAEFRRAEPDADGLNTAAWHIGLWVLVAVFIVIVACRRRSWLSAVGASWCILMLAPVLPFLHHSFQQYLYPAFPGLTIVCGEAWDVLVSALDGVVRRRRPPPAPGARRAVPQGRGPSPLVGAVATAVVVIAIAANSNALLAHRWYDFAPGLGLPADNQLRRSELARHVSESLAPALVRESQRIVFVFPPRRSRRIDPASGTVVDDDRGPSLMDAMNAALDNGRALRMLHPGVDSVALVEVWSPRFRDFDIIGIAAPNGRCVDLGNGPPAHYALLDALIGRGFDRQARDHLTSALAAYPADSGLRRIEAQLLTRTSALTVPMAEPQSISGR